MTGRELIVRAFKMNSIATPSTTQLANALILLNDMLSSWSIDGLIVPSAVYEYFDLVEGSSVYSIGSGGSFDTIRPYKMLSCFIRDSENQDHNVEPTMNRWEYDRLESG